ncbi:MAG: GNAT family N-acetyltransferase, partial [Acetatifactor sp.]|nr:GNAT family N-acetyltransferase [Acetatifactor sp.]
MEITVRELLEEDIPRLAEIEAESFSMPWSAQDFKNLLSYSYCNYVVAVADGQVAGCCGFSNACGVANIDNVVVAADFRGKGIAQMMLQELIAAGEAEQVEAYTLA